MDREALNEAQQEAVRALEQGRETLARLAWSRVGRGGFNPLPDGVRHLAGAVADPGRFWGLAATGALGGNSVEGQAAAELSAAAIRAAAARIKIGDFDPIREAMIGQAAWLGATAVRLMAVADEIESGQRAAEQRAELMKLALRASDQAAKVLASAAALNAIGGYASVTTE